MSTAREDLGFWCANCPFNNNPKIVCVCVRPSEHGGNLRSMQRSVEVDGQRLQGLIDGNKRWLEMRKKDTNVYPYITHTHPRTHIYYCCAEPA